MKFARCVKVLVQDGRKFRNARNVIHDQCQETKTWSSNPPVIQYDQCVSVSATEPHTRFIFRRESLLYSPYTSSSFIIVKTTTDIPGIFKYTKGKLPDLAPITQILDQSSTTTSSVHKQRHIWTYMDYITVHMDKVTNIGYFVEILIPMNPEEPQDVETNDAVIKSLLKELGLDGEPRLDNSSYADMDQTPQ